MPILITLPPEIIDSGCGDIAAKLSDALGKIEFLKTPAYEKVKPFIETGNFSINPYGFGEKDDNGNITSFKLIGFSLNVKQNNQVIL